MGQFEWGEPMKVVLSEPSKVECFRYPGDVMAVGGSVTAEVNSRVDEGNVECVESDHCLGGQRWMCPVVL